MSVPSASKDDLETQPLPNDLSEPWNIHILYRLLKEYVDFLKKIHGVEIISVTSPCSAAAAKRAYQLNYDEKRTTHPPEVWLCKGISGGIVLLHLHFQNPYFVLDMHTWEDTPICFKAEADVPDSIRARTGEMSSTVARLLTGLHFHSFTYDFHLRMLANFLSGRAVEFFKSGYDTNAFLADFLQYYSCRPAYAQNCVYEERLAYKLGFGVRGLIAWNNLVDTHTDYGWKALKLKQNTHEGVQQRDYVLVASSQVPSLSSESLSVRAVLYDMAQSNKQSDILFVVVYMIQIIPPNEPIKPPSVMALQSSSRIRHESAPLSAMVPFARVDVVDAEQVIVVAEIETEKLQKMINSEGDETTVEGRRRFSSGGVLSATPPVDIPTYKQSNETDSYVEPKMPMFPVSPRSIPKETIIMPIEMAKDAHNLALNPPRLPELTVHDPKLPLPITNSMEITSMDEAGTAGEHDTDGYADDGRTDAERETEIDDKPARRHRQERAGDIPEEKFAFYVTFVSEKQKMLQQWIEDSMKAYKNDLKKSRRGRRATMSSREVMGQYRTTPSSNRSPTKTGHSEVVKYDKRLEQKRSLEANGLCPPRHGRSRGSGVDVFFGDSFTIG